MILNVIHRNAEIFKKMYDQKKNNEREGKDY